MLRARVAASTPPPSTADDLYQPDSPRPRLGRRISSGVSDPPSPWSSSTGFGWVTSDTPTVTTASAMNATPAPQNAAACAVPRLIVPQSVRECAAAAPNVPATSPASPAHGVARFQNSAMMNVANSGALKNENSSWM